MIESLIVNYTQISSKDKDSNLMSKYKCMILMSYDQYSYISGLHLWQVNYPHNHKQRAYLNA